MKSCEKIDSYGGFIDNSKKMNESEMHLSLQKLMFQKIIKKSISISLQTYDKTGEVHNFGNQYHQGLVTFFFVFAEKNIVFVMLGGLILGLTGLSLTKNVGTPNPV